MLRYAVAVTAAIVLGSGFSRAQPAPCDPNVPATDAQVAGVGQQSPGRARSIPRKPRCGPRTSGLRRYRN